MAQENRSRMEDWRILYATLGVCLLVSVLFFAGLHGYFEQAAAKTGARAEQAQEQYTAIANFKNAHLDWAAYEKEIAEHEARSEKALPSTMEQGSFIRSLQHCAAASHIVLKKVSPEAEERVDELRQLPIHVAFQCQYFELLDFLQGMSETERFSRVEEMKIVQKDGSLDCTIRLFIYATGVEEARKE